MATVNNVVIPNVAKGAGVQDLWPHYWAATRAMKKAGWKYLASGDGTSKDTSANPANDLWGAGVSTGNTGAAATFAAATVRGRLLITGLTGMVTASKGRFLTFTGTSGGTNNSTVQIEEYVSATSVYVDARSFTFTLPEANNGSISWTEFNPTTQTLPAGLATVAAWWLGRGPSTIRIPITSAPTPGGSGFTFIRGENVTQATTSAEGEIVGFVFNTLTSTGYLVVLPRLIGTGGGVFGWGTGNTITGATSGATVSQNGTALEYRQQVVIAKAANQTTGAIYIQCIEPVGESASSFATLAVSAGCTATVWPGGGGTGNGFPTIAYTGLGAGGVTTGNRWSAATSANPVFANGQIMAADAIWEEDYSADGTWQVHSALVVAADATFKPGRYHTRGLYRMDDTEPGDLDPFVYFGITLATLYSGITANRTVAADSSTPADFIPDTATSYQNVLTNTVVHFRGWGRRGLGSEDEYTDMEAAFLQPCQQQTPSTVGADFMVQINPGGGDNVRSEPVITRAREPVRVVATQTARKIRKGTVRHLSAVGGATGSGGTTYDGGRFMQLNDAAGAFVAGPWDQLSVPVA